ncbi:MAG: T9SS type A sorting domain-containing protein [Flavobacteriales bacterium]|nr:T9SS type A sorting domain-containing protein [Flavobacteriales bacterium]
MAKVGVGGLYAFLEDTTLDVLYCSGAAFHADDDVTSPGIFKWDGTQFQAMGCGVNWDCVTPLSNGGLANGGVTAMAFWNDELYIGGDITELNGEPAAYVARWDGNAWQNVGVGFNGPVRKLRAYPDGLYAVGYFDEAEGQAAHGLARWDGTAWNSVFDLPVISPWQELNLLQDVAWYNGKLYIGGNFGGGTGTGLNDIMCWDGNAWGPIGNGFLGVFSSVQVLEVHDGLLYVAGSFADYPPYGNVNNPGSGILTWDGSNWAQLGSGTRGAVNASVNSLTWINDTLHAGGRFNVIGDVPTGRVAKWDGTKWCSLVPPDYFDIDLGPVGQFRDTLLVSGSFLMAGPDSVRRVGKWIGGDYVDTCSVTTSLPEIIAEWRLDLFPNPANNRITLFTEGPTQITITDALARTVWSGMVNGRETIDVSKWAAGSYTLRHDHGAMKLMVVH